MTKRITVGYDGSAPSSEAVSWAAAEANIRGASLRIITCFEVPFSGEAIGGWAATEAYASLIEAGRERPRRPQSCGRRNLPRTQIVTEASAGPAGFVLADSADADDTIVVGASSHRGAGASGRQHTPLRRQARPVSGRRRRGAASRGRPDRVVVGDDASHCLGRALQWAGQEADLHQVGLVIVHGWLYPYLPSTRTSSQARPDEH